jgi:glucosamine--fructose-6-phosphate aminotransferase (isomerizing)
MRAELAEQPERWQDLLDRQGVCLRRLRDRILSHPPRLVLFAARGTSENAATYGQYLVQTSLGIPAACASPSVVTLYGGRLDLTDVLVVAVSQSGESPDLVSYAEMARHNGAQALALTNVPSSTLAGSASDVVELAAGPETSVAATKSYTAELLALAALFGRPDTVSFLPRLPRLGADVLGRAAPAVQHVADRYRSVTRAVVAARGYSSASAREAALKLMETCYISAHGFSAAELLHGPVAMLDESTPLLCFAAQGPDAAEMADLAERVRGQGVAVDVVGDGTLDGGRLPPQLPADVPPEVRPLLEIIPAQLLAAETSLARGQDPDAPRGLSKVTRTY